MSTALHGFRCRNCRGSEASVRFAKLRDRYLGHAGAFDVVTCTTCGLTQLGAPLREAARYYGGYPVHRRRSALGRVVERAIVGDCYLSEPGNGRRLLDVGCGNGSYLEAMTELGWCATGVELDDDHVAALRARGLDVLCGTQALGHHEQCFDLVTLNFALEHFEDPLPVLDVVTRCLRPGGRVYITVPNLEGLEARLFRRRWFHLDPPRHISFFTKRLLALALESRGFTSIAIKNLPVASGFAGSMSYLVAGRFHPLIYLGLLAPGMLFASVVGDGNFAITAQLPT